MVKRKCGTCRHFKDGGIAGSGWCQHQARKDIQHMVLVRKSELACRNSWDQDLWELADRPMDIQQSAHIPMPISGGEPQDVAVIQAELPADDVARAGEMFTDRITSISMPTRSQLRPGRFEAEAEPDEAAGSELQGSRSSVREARKRRQEQRHLERRKHQETVLQRADDLLDKRTPVDEADESIVRVRASDGPMTTNPVEIEKPQRKHDQPPPPPPPVQPAIKRSEPAPSIEFAATPPTFGNQNPPKQSKRHPGPGVLPSDETSNGSRSRSALERGETEPLPSAAEVREAVNNQRKRPTAPSTTQVSQSIQAHEEPKSRRETKTRAEARVNAPRADVPVDLQPPVEQRQTKWYTGAGKITQPAIVDESPAPLAIDPIDLARDLQTIRRCCATCRDFKQVGDGRTGWCNNPYAFAEKRMVQSNEIACRSSLGVWWLPHDDLWLEFADTTHHGRPTPLLDDMVSAVPAERQGMGQRSSR